MRISAKDWAMYISRLERLNRTAADLMRDYIEQHGSDDMEALTEYAFALETKYGEGAASLACEMYDAIARAQHAQVPLAEPAETAPFWETRVAMRGTSDAEKPGAVSRLVKRAAADTMLKNAARDGAQFAWIPAGDTCAFCIALASRGWQYASKESLKNGHADHIHANCDCEYAIRFDQTSTVQGYDPDKYRKMYDNAEGDTPQEKINSMRRGLAAEKKDLQKQGESGIVKKQGEFRVDTGKKRNEQPLTIEQKEECKRIAVAYGMPEDKIVFVEDMYTGYFPLGDKLYIGTDVYPSGNTEKANYKLSHTAAIAHEIVGHREAALLGKTQLVDYLEEAQASLRASKAHGLSDIERKLLVEDAKERLPEGVELDDVIHLLFLEV